MELNQIIAEHRQRLTIVEKSIRALQTSLPTPSNMELAFKLAMERNHLRESLSALSPAL